MVLIAGTGYTGEIKKGIFTVLNYLMPHQHNVLSMHCSANMSESGDTALFFGLSGTGKTTLSADNTRMLIGDDEHGWSRDNVFNFEGGCYAKVINLSEEKEPEIFHAIQQGAMLENTVCFLGTNKVDFSSSCITENTRVSYPIDFITNARKPSTGNVPSNIFFLTCDAYGVLPPISRLTPGAGDVSFYIGLYREDCRHRSGSNRTCFYFQCLFWCPVHSTASGQICCDAWRQNQKTQSKCVACEYGLDRRCVMAKGSRMKLEYTRAMIRAAVVGQTEKCAIRSPSRCLEWIFPTGCEGVPSDILYPRDTWKDKDAYDAQALMLAKKFIKNFEKYQDGVDDEIEGRTTDHLTFGYDLQIITLQGMFYKVLLLAIPLFFFASTR